MQFINEERQLINSLKPIKAQSNSTLELEDTYNKIYQIKCNAKSFIEDIFNQI
jgi:hypothetical protein